MKIFKTILILSLFCLPVMAQTHRSIVVVDMDTYQIIPDVSVKVDNRMIVFTDKQGRVDIGEPFDSVMFSHVRYGKEKLLAKEVTDTMYLLPNEHLLPEVIVSELKRVGERCRRRRGNAGTEGCCQLRLLQPA